MFIRQFSYNPSLVWKIYPITDWLKSNFLTCKQKTETERKKNSLECFLIYVEIAETKKSNNNKSQMWMPRTMYVSGSERKSVLCCSRFVLLCQNTWWQKNEEKRAESKANMHICHWLKNEICVPMWNMSRCHHISSVKIGSFLNTKLPHFSIKVLLFSSLFSHFYFCAVSNIHTSARYTLSKVLSA